MIEALAEILSDAELVSSTAARRSELSGKSSSGCRAQRAVAETE